MLVLTWPLTSSLLILVFFLFCFALQALRGGRGGRRQGGNRAADGAVGEGAQTDRYSLGGFELCPSPGAAAGGHEQHAGVCANACIRVFFLVFIKIIFAAHLHDYLPSSLLLILQNFTSRKKKRSGKSNRHSLDFSLDAFVFSAEDGGETEGGEQPAENGHFVPLPVSRTHQFSPAVLGTRRRRPFVTSTVGGCALTQELQQRAE